eukprot:1121991-Rhodomonas_salina.4
MVWSTGSSDSPRLAASSTCLPGLYIPAVIAFHARRPNNATTPTIAAAQTATDCMCHAMFPLAPGAPRC